MSIEQNAVELAVRDYLRAFDRFNAVDVVLVVEELPEGWQVGVQPANSYLRRHRSDLTMSLFFDWSDGRIHHIPSYGLTLYLARLRRLSQSNEEARGPDGK